MRRTLLPLVLLLAACQAKDAPAPDAAAPGDAPSATPDSTATADSAATAGSGWRAVPADGVRLRGSEPLTVETGPHAVLWRAVDAPLSAPYAVEATLQKRVGRLHEGYGLVFGASGLEGAEAAQRYSYFLVRGDGSFLVKLRRGARTPVVRDWTTHPSIRRDAEESGQPNLLRVEVGTAETIFLVNGTEVARVPTAELEATGAAGIRVAHDVELRVSGFGTRALAAAP